MQETAKYLAAWGTRLEGMLAHHHPPAGAVFGVSVWRRVPGTSQRQLLFCNNDLAELAGRPLNYLLRHPDPMQLIKRLDNQKAILRRENQAAAGQPFRGLYSWLRPDNRENIVEYIGAPVLGTRGINVMRLDWDITDQVRRACGGREALLDSFDMVKMMWTLFVDRHRWVRN